MRAREELATDGREKPVSLAPAELWSGLSGFRKCGGQDERKGSYGADPPAGLREKGTVSPKASPPAQKHLVGDLASGKATCSATTLGTSHGLSPGGSWTWQPPAQPLDGADLSRAQPSLVGHWHPGSSPDHAAPLSLQRPDWEERLSAPLFQKTTRHITQE